MAYSKPLFIVIIQFQFNYSLNTFFTQYHRHTKIDALVSIPTIKICSMMDTLLKFTPFHLMAREYCLPLCQFNNSF